MSKNKSVKEENLTAQQMNETAIATDNGKGNSAQKQEKTQQDKKAKNAKDAKNAKKKGDNQESFGKKVKRKTRETVGELKKVTWPSFGDVCKKTGIVLSVVVLFGLVLFGFDMLFGWLFGLLT